tara:strand:- start:1349 stop:1648 length:300 start_codon:yes stop_codon:yes gene_type:complete
MQFKDWTTLKTAGKVAFKRQPEVAEVKDSDGNVTTQHQSSYIYLEKKVYDVNTGAESIAKQEMTLAYLENVKAKKTAEKAALQTEIAEIGKMITQIKKV